MVREVHKIVFGTGPDGGVVPILLHGYRRFRLIPPNVRAMIATIASFAGSKTDVFSLYREAEPHMIRDKNHWRGNEKLLTLQASAQKGVTRAGELILLVMMWIVRRLITEVDPKKFKNVADAIDPHLKELPDEIIAVGEKNWTLEEQIFVDQIPTTRRSKVRQKRHGSTSSIGQMSAMGGRG